ncbi:dethiobiotin synthase [Paenibacillus tarimensis]
MERQKLKGNYVIGNSVKAASLRGLFVTGTDTGVGKTVITAAITAALRSEGISAGVWKPVQSGAPLGSTDSDAHRLSRWSGTGDLPGDIAPFSYEAPLTPYLAAREAGVELTLDKLLQGGRPLAERHDVLLVEGAGGIAAPLTTQELVIDLIEALGMPVLIVAKSGLGTINHTLLTLSMLRQRHIRVAGVVLNETITDKQQDDPSRDTNGVLIARYGRVPVLGCFPYIERKLTPALLARQASEKLQLAVIRAALSRSAAPHKKRL